MIDNEDLDLSLLDLFKKYKEINEQQAGEKIDNETLRLDFSFVILEKIGEMDLTFIDEEQEARADLIRKYEIPSELEAQENFCN